MSKTKEIEEWKSLDFLGFPDYEVSTFGNVKSLNYRRSGKEKILKFGKTKKGYLQITLCRNGKRKNYDIQRLVGLAFLKNDNNLPCVNHKDENPLNNHVENLEWCTHKYNSNYGTCKERISKANSKPIQQYTKYMTFIKEWDSIKSASEELNINNRNICSCCQGKLKSSGGFIWRYKE